MTLDEECRHFHELAVKMAAERQEKKKAATLLAIREAEDLLISFVIAGIYILLLFGRLDNLQ